MSNLEAPVAIDVQVGFNPYYEWLGVRELRRPLNAYQLLGLRQHENDADLIRTAVEAKREALQRRRGEAASEEIWEQIHFELEEAAAALLNPRAPSGLRRIHAGAVRSTPLIRRSRLRRSAAARRSGRVAALPAVQVGQSRRSQVLSPIAANPFGSRASIATRFVRRPNGFAAVAGRTWPRPSTSKPSSSR